MKKKDFKTGDALEENGLSGEEVLDCLQKMTYQYVSNKEHCICHQ